MLTNLVLHLKWYDRLEAPPRSLILSESEAPSNLITMAMTAFPDISKHITLEDGTGYSYVYIAAVARKPTFLLIHGFPSSSYDWRHQIKYLSAKGFGVIAPDLLGYGDTDSPLEVEAYSTKRMSDHVAEILKRENVESVIGVGHDW